MSSEKVFTETLPSNILRPETSLNSYSDGAVKIGLDRSHKEYSFFHANPTPRHRGKAAEKTSIISVSTDFSSDIGSKVKLRSCHTPKPFSTPLIMIQNKTMESAKQNVEAGF